MATTNPVVKTLTSIDEYYNVVANTTGLSVIRVYAAWCGPCRRTASPYADIADERSSDANFYQMDIDDTDAWRKLGIKTVPTFIFARGHTEVGRVSDSDMEHIRLRVTYNT